MCNYRLSFLLPIGVVGLKELRSGIENANTAKTVTITEKVQKNSESESTTESIEKDVEACRSGKSDYTCSTSRDQVDKVMAPSGGDTSDDSETDYSDTEMLPATSSSSGKKIIRKDSIAKKRKSSL